MINTTTEHNHLHMLGTAWVRKPPITVEQADEFLKTLVSKIGMSVLMGPYSINCTDIGNEGITGAIVLSFSHASFHCWSEVENPFMTFAFLKLNYFDLLK